MTTQELMSIYENVASITSEMVVAAQQGDWQLLAKLEADCSAQVQTIKENDAPVALKEDERERKVRVIKKILADDKIIRDITEPAMARLNELINSSTRSANTQHKLATAYQLDHRHP